MPTVLKLIIKVNQWLGSLVRRLSPVQNPTKLSDIFEGYEDDGHAFINLNITKKNDKE